VDKTRLGYQSKLTIVCLGIFWIKDGGAIFMVYKQAISTAKAGEGYKAAEMSHPLFWYENVEKLAPEYTGSNYQSIPRGRVIWDDINNKVLVFLCREFLDNKVTRANIIREFNLSNGEFLYDGHYDLVNRD
jgi:hypothetical protein